jgi:hypothetical protein
MLGAPLAVPGTNRDPRSDLVKRRTGNRATLLPVKDAGLVRKINADCNVKSVSDANMIARERAGASEGDETATALGSNDRCMGAQVTFMHKVDVRHKSGVSPC